MNLSHKILIGFIVISLINILPAFVRLQSTLQIEEELNGIIESTLYEHEGISQLAYYLQRTKSNLRELLLEISIKPRRAEIENAKTVILTSIVELNSNLEILNKATLEGGKLAEVNTPQDEHNEEVEQVKAIAENLDVFIKGTRDVLAVSENMDDVNYYLALFVRTVEPISRVLQTQIDEFKLHEFKEVRHELEELRAQSKDMLRLIAVFSSIAFMSSLAMGILFSRHIRSIS